MFSDCEKCTHCSRWYRAFESYCEYIEEMVLSDPNDPDYEEYTKNEKLINKAEENNAPCPLFNLKVLEQNPKLKSDIKSVSKNLIKNLTEDQVEDIIKHTMDVISLDKKLGDDESCTISELIPDENAFIEGNVEDKMLSKNFEDLLKEVVYKKENRQEKECKVN